MANAAGAPKVVSLRTIKSDVVVGLGDDGDKVAEHLDKTEPGWKISGKYVSSLQSVLCFMPIGSSRLWFYSRRGVLEKKFALPRVLVLSPLQIPVSEQVVVG